MARYSPIGAILLLAVAGPSGLFGADGETPDEVLKRHELRRVGTTYVLPAEADVEKKLNEARTLHRQLSYALLQQRAYEQARLGNKAAIRELTQQRMLVSQQLANASSTDEHNRLAAMSNQITDRLQLLHDQGSDTETRDKINAEVPRQRQAFIQAVLDLRQLVDETKRQYEEQAQDDEVKSALEALNQKTKSKLTLGPSSKFLASERLLKKAESAVLTESIDLRSDGGVYVLDATFNGKVTREVIFDTGASSITLPTELAAELGLKPGPDTPKVICQIANGQEVEASLMTLPSVRVGKFTVKNVECIVMPPGKNVPALLGQSFLRNFTYKFTPESRKLLLSEVETAEGVKAPAAPKSTTRPGKSKRSSTK